MKTVQKNTINSSTLLLNVKKAQVNPATMRMNNMLNEPYKKAIKGLIGHPLNAETLLHYNSKSVVYSFNKVNNLYPLLTKTEYLLKSFFLSMYSLISKPIYLIKHDKIIIRLFLFLSPKVDKFLDTSVIGQEGKLQGASPTIFIRKVKSGLNLRYVNKFLKYKSFRPKTVDILNYQIKLSSNLNHTLDTIKHIVYKIPNHKDKERLELVRFLSLRGERNTLNTLPLKEKTNLPFTMLRVPGESTIPNNSYLSLVSNYKNKLEKLIIIISKILKKKVEIEIIKAQLPFQNSNLLAQILGYNSNKYKFRRMLNILTPRAVIKNPSKEFSYNSASSLHKQAIGLGFYVSLPASFIHKFRPSEGLEKEANLYLKKKDINIFYSQPSSYLPPFFYSKFLISLIKPIFIPRLLNMIRSGMVNKHLFPSYLSGMNIKLAGRLINQSIRPRFTVQRKQEGSLARVKVHILEKSRFTGKNKRGAFSFTVTISHVLNK